jgi:hypothetical protein
MTILVSPLLAQQSQNALFNGKNLDGWEHVGPGSMVVEDGMMKTEGGMGLLWYSREKVGDATVRVMFKLTGKESDSGVFIRIPEKPTEPWMPVNRGYEVEIGEWPDDYSCTGVLYIHKSPGASNQNTWRMEHDGDNDGWAAHGRVSEQHKSDGFHGGTASPPEARGFYRSRSRASSRLRLHRPSEPSGLAGLLQGSDGFPAGAATIYCSTTW